MKTKENQGAFQFFPLIFLRVCPLLFVTHPRSPCLTSASICLALVSRLQFNLGVSYANGDGVAKDAAIACEWWRKAAEQGVASAQARHLSLSLSLRVHRPFLAVNYVRVVRIHFRLSNFW